MKKEGKMAKLEGHFQLEKNENMDEYFSKVGKISNEKKIPNFCFPQYTLGGWALSRKIGSVKTPTPEPVKFWEYAHLACIGVNKIGITTSLIFAIKKKTWHKYMTLSKNIAGEVEGKVEENCEK